MDIRVHVFKVSLRYRRQLFDGTWFLRVNETEQLKPLVGQNLAQLVD
jgi:hypothetical protein